MLTASETLEFICLVSSEISENQLFTLDQGKFQKSILDNFWSIIFSTVKNADYTGQDDDGGDGGDDWDPEESPASLYAKIMDSGVCAHFIDCKTYTISQLRSCISAMTQIYYDLYGISGALEFPHASLGASLPQCQIPFVYDFLQLQLSRKSDVRTVMHLLYKANAATGSCSNDSYFESNIISSFFGDCFDEVLFKDLLQKYISEKNTALEHSENVITAGLVTVGMRHNSMQVDNANSWTERLSKRFRNQFYLDLAKIGLPEDALYGDDGLCGAMQVEKKNLPIMEVLLQDLSYNPARVESWWRLFCALVELHHSLIDRLGELCVPYSLIGQSNDHWYLQPLESLRNVIFTSLEPNSVSGSNPSDAALRILFKKKQHVVESVRRCVAVLRILGTTRIPVEWSESFRDTTKFKLEDSMEMLASIYYIASLEFDQMSAQKRLENSKALTLFAEVAPLKKGSFTGAAFSYYMAGKLTWQLHRTLGESLRLLKVSADEDASTGGHKPLKIAIFYQVNGCFTD